MRKKVFLTTGLMLVLIFFTITVCMAESLKFKFTGHMPVGHQCTIAAEKFVQEVSKRSNGQIEITYYPAGQLAMDKKALEMLQTGGIQMAQFFTNRAVGIIPEVQLTVPYFDDLDWFSRRLYDVESGGGLFLKYIKPAFEAKGIYVMPGFLYSPEHSTITKKPITKLADYEGLKIRSSGRELAIAVESWGAKSVVMSSADVYMALQRGTVDGANSGITSIISRKWYEVADNVQLLWELPSSLDVIVNLKWWNSLNDQQRSIIKESLRDTAIWSWQQTIDQVDKDIAFLKEKGLKVFDMKKEAPSEHEKMRQATIVALEKHLVGSSGITPELWKEHIGMLEKTRNGTLTWKEILRNYNF